MVTRIVQLTDLHLTAAAGRSTWGSDVWGNLQRTLDHLRAHYSDLDLLVLSGDLANQRQPATYARLRATLAPWLERVVVLPGNHDNRAMLRAAFHDRMVPGRSTVNFVTTIAGWKLIGLDSLRRWCVHGKLGREQLDWLAQQLRATERPVLLFVHHPPIRVGTWWLDKDRLRDWRAFGRALRGSSVRGCACGHAHQEITGALGGVPVWVTPSTAYQFRPHALLPGAAQRTPAFRVFELHDATVLSSVVRLP